MRICLGSRNLVRYSVLFVLSSAAIANAFAGTVSVGSSQLTIEQTVGSPSYSLQGGDVLYGAAAVAGPLAYSYPGSAVQRVKGNAVIQLVYTPSPGEFADPVNQKPNMQIIVQRKSTYRCHAFNDDAEDSYVRAVGFARATLVLDGDISKVEEAEMVANPPYPSIGSVSGNPYDTIAVDSIYSSASWVWDPVSGTYKGSYTINFFVDCSASVTGTTGFAIASSIASARSRITHVAGIRVASDLTP